MADPTSLPALSCEETKAQRGGATQLARGRLKLEPSAPGSEATVLSLPVPCALKSRESSSANFQSLIKTSAGLATHSHSP